MFEDSYSRSRSADLKIRTKNQLVKHLDETDITTDLFLPAYVT